MNKLIIAAALTGSGTSKEANPNVPYSAGEIAEQAVACARAGASAVHIHVREDNGWPTMDTGKFTAAFEVVKAATEAAGVDVIVNLTTSGSAGIAPNDIRLAHLKKLRPEMCSFDAGTMNWNNGGVFLNAPDFLEELSATVVAEGIKPEIEIFDNGMIGNSLYYIKKHGIPTPCHFQFVLGVGGGADGTVRNLNFLHEMLPPGSTWSVTGIGKPHLPMLLTALAMGADGVRVGLEDNLYYARGVKATNVQLVERAAELARLAGREIATTDEARAILGITRHALAEYRPT